ncbi:MAG: hypothetical protein ACOY93_14425 [Bacillota bacterium]
MWIFPEKTRSASVVPVEGGPAVIQGWSALGLPETGWVLITDASQCQLCPDPTARFCEIDCRTHPAACSFCADRLLSGELPHCVDACPHGAIWIGNLERNNATNGIRVTRLSELLRRRRFMVTEPDRRTVILQP